MREGIAVVGMACRYAGARTPAELWDNVLAGRREFRRIPPERLRLEDYLAPDPADPLDSTAASPDSLYSTEAAVLEGWEFDRVHFRVAGSTFRSADLAHWLALETADRALADAGFPAGEGLPRDATGVLLGNSLTGEMARAQLMRLRWPYVRRVLAASLARDGWEGPRIADLLARLETDYKAPFPEPGEESLAGGLSNTIAGRICNHFDLHGGGYTLDGACASSLLAVANACSALTAGDLDVALAGGVDLSLDPFELVGFARTGALAPGEMRVYDARSAGFIPGEGCGFVVLMREEDAVRRGGRIWAVIRGWGISSDGHGGISRPEPEGQKLALRRAYRRAGFGIETVGYFEGHGTGTAVGDAAELSALSGLLNEALPAPDPPTPVGSVKANIGHTKAAAGVAGLIKAVLAVHARILPPNTGCSEPHPALRGAPLRVLERGEAWPEDRPRRAGVSAMGFGGINSHVVLEEAADAEPGDPSPPWPPSPIPSHPPGEGGNQRLAPRERMLLASAQDAELVLFAASDAASLASQIEPLVALAPRLALSEMTDLAFVLHGRAVEGGAEPLRAAVVAATPRELAARLEILLGWLREPKDSPRLDPRQGLFLSPCLPSPGGREGMGEGPGVRGRPPRLGFLFPGQGSPAYPGRGGALARRFDLLDGLYELASLPPAGTADPADLVDTAVAQPAILTHSLAGLTILERLGVSATVAVGHSLGEITALCWAGSLDAEAATRLAALRGRAMADVDGGRPGGGTMVSVAASARIVRGLLDGTEAVIAAFNAPERTVVSGSVADVEQVLSRAAARGLTTTRLRVSHAFHSPRVAAAAPRLAEALVGLALRPPARPVASTVTGDLLAADADLRALLVRQVTEPVQLTRALAAVRDMADLWIEIGPGHALTDLASESLDQPVLALDAGGPSLAGLLAAAGAAYALGAPVNTAFLFDGRFTRPFDMDRPLRFLANPCESAPLPGVDFAVLPLPETAKPETDQAAAAPDQGSALEVVRRLVAARTELPAAAVREDSRLLSDLHLNSISVGQLVGEAARCLGLRPPASPTDYAQATVAEVAAALEEQARLAPAEGSSGEPATAPAGVDTWVRPFTVELVPRDLPRIAPGASMTGPVAGTWTLVAPPDHPLCIGLEAALKGLGSVGVVLCLPAEPGEEHAGLFLEAAKTVLAAPHPGCFAVVQQGGGGGGFARTLHLELPQWTTCVVDLPFDDPQAVSRITAEIRAAHGYVEAIYDAEGTRRVPVLRPLDPHPSGPPLPGLAPEDILLVTGGGKGIAAECALDLARTTGARLALLGRSAPENDAELAANLERMRAAGLDPLYLRADVTDAAQVRAACERIAASLGPVTAVLHGAGANAPRLLGALDEAAFRRTLAPKVGGLDNVLAALAALDPGRLRLLVAFGSIIARTGLRGEADYAVANEWLALRVDRFARENPACRCLTLEWSVWAGVGMGERLGTLESLIRQGITPIPPDAGLAALRDLLARPLPVSSVVVAGRFGEPPTLAIERPEIPLLRFLEKPRVFYPGIELVVDAEISADTDPYLADHVFHGEPLFAAVLGLEAMAQAARLLTGRDGLPIFEQVELRRPVAVPPGRSTTVRVAALVRDPNEPGTVELALRDAATGFQSDHFRAVCRLESRPVETAESANPRLVAFPSTADPARLPLDPATDLYGGILFQQGRFRRLSSYRRLRATECLADIAPDGAVPWFGRWMSEELVLGDPGARDAALHGIQACIPHSTLLPTGVDRLVCGRIGNSTPLTFAARERSRHGDDFVYDLEILGADGSLCERWEGLRLRAVDRIAAPVSWKAALLGPYVERRLQEILPGSGVRVALDRRTEESPLRHRPDGRPETDDGRQVSISHASSLVLSVSRDGRIGCDLEPVAERPDAVWRDLLGAERFALAERIARERGESTSDAATRVWAAAESLTKAGAPHGAPLLLDETSVPGERPDGWLLLRSGRLRVSTFVGPVRELAGFAALAVLVDEPAEIHAARL